MIGWKRSYTKNSTRDLFIVYTNIRIWSRRWDPHNSLGFWEINRSPDSDQKLDLNKTNITFYPREFPSQIFVIKIDNICTSELYEKKKKKKVHAFIWGKDFKKIQKTIKQKIRSLIFCLDQTKSQLKRKKNDKIHVPPVKLKENENIDKYLKIASKIKKTFTMKLTVISICIYPSPPRAGFDTVGYFTRSLTGLVQSFHSPRLVA